MARVEGKCLKREGFKEGASFTLANINIPCANSHQVHIYRKSGHYCRRMVLFQRYTNPVHTTQHRSNFQKATNLISVFHKGYQLLNPSIIIQAVTGRCVNLILEVVWRRGKVYHAISFLSFFSPHFHVLRLSIYNPLGYGRPLVPEYYWWSSGRRDMRLSCSLPSFSPSPPLGYDRLSLPLFTMLLYC